MKVAGTHSWFLFLDFYGPLPSGSPSEHLLSLDFNGPLPSGSPSVHLLSLDFDGPLPSGSPSEHLLSLDFDGPLPSGLSFKFVYVKAQIKFLTWPLTRVNPFPAVEKLRLADGQSLRKNPRPLPGLTDYGYPDYWNPHIFLGSPGCTSERDIILCLSELRRLTQKYMAKQIVPIFSKQISWNRTRSRNLESPLTTADEKRWSHYVQISPWSLTHSYLFRNEDPPECIYCACRLTVKHILIECPDFELSRQKYFNWKTLTELFEKHQKQILWHTWKKLVYIAGFNDLVYTCLYISK